MEYKWRQLELSCHDSAAPEEDDCVDCDVDGVEDKDCLTDNDGVDDSLTEDGGVTDGVTDGVVQDAEVAVK